MTSLSKGIGKVEVKLKWGPSPAGAPASDLDLIAATYHAADPYGPPAYLVHFASRSPDGTIVLNRDSQTGQGFGFDEIMTFELDRLAPSYARVVAGVIIQQGGGRMTFGHVANTAVQIVAGYTKLAENDFSTVSGCTAATVAEFTRNRAGNWEFHEYVYGFVVDPDSFARMMGRRLR